MVKTTKLMGAAALALSTAFAGGAMTLGATASAQDATSGALTGSVSDTSGNPISGATVTVTSNDRGFTRTATTSATGSYRVPQLPTGTYTVSISAGGFDGVSNENIRISLSSTADYSATLVAAGSGDEVVVSGQAQSISAFDANTTGLTVDVGELSARIPVQRDISSVAILAPGTAQTDTGFTAGTNRGASATQIGIAGGSVGENVFYINGFNISDFNDFIGASVVPFEFYDQVEVKTAGTSAEFGRATGGFVNATTKSGSNEFEGGFKVFWAPDELREAPQTTFVDDGSGSLTPLNANYLDETDELEANLFLSGPIIEDKLFFYALYAPKDDKQTDILNTNAFIETNDSTFWGGKIDFFLTDTQHFEYTYFKDEETYVTDIYDALIGADGFQTGVDFESEVRTQLLKTGGDNHIYKYSGQWTDWFTLSASYGEGINLNQNLGSNAGGVFAAFDDVTGERLTNYAVGLTETTTNERKSYRVDADIFANFLGEHQIRFGYDREELSAAFDDKYAGPSFSFVGNSQWANVRGAAETAPGSGLYAYETTGAFFTVLNRNEDGSINEFEVRSRVADGFFETENEAFYVQDAWSIHPNVTLNLGVRAETFSNSNSDGEVFFDTDTLISPRLGANWDVLGDSTLQIGGFYGRYYLPVATNTNFRLAGNERDTTNTYTAQAGFDLNNPLDANGQITNATLDSSEVNSNGFTADTFESVASNLEPQYVDEFVASVRHTITDASPFYFGGLFDNWDVGLTFTSRELFDALEDAAVDAAVLAYCDENGISGCEATWSGFHHYVLINPGGDIEYATDELPNQLGTVVPITIDGSFLPEAERTYKAVSLEWERPFDGKWSFRGNYTWSDLEGNYEGSVKSDIAQTDAGLTQDFDQPGLTDGTFGKLPQHREHQLKMWGNYAVTDDFFIGANFSLSSPRQFGCLGHHPTDQFAVLYGEASFFCLPQGTEGDYYTPSPVIGFDEATIQSIRPNNLAGDGVTQLTPRGSQLESDWITEVNLSFVYTPPAADDRLSVRLDVFNVFDEQGVTDLNEIGESGNFLGYRPDPNYGLPRGYQTPREMRVGIEYKF